MRSELLKLLDAVERHERRLQHSPEAADDDDLHAVARSVRAKLEAQEAAEARELGESLRGSDYSHGGY